MAAASAAPATPRGGFALFTSAPPVCWLVRPGGRNDAPWSAGPESPRRCPGTTARWAYVLSCNSTAADRSLDESHPAPGRPSWSGLRSGTDRSRRVWWEPQRPELAGPGPVRCDNGVGTAGRSTSPERGEYRRSGAGPHARWSGRRRRRGRAGDHAVREWLARLVPQGALLLSVLTFVSDAMGLVRDRVFARTFGAGPELDAYNAAFVLPTRLEAA